MTYSRIMKYITPVIISACLCMVVSSFVQSAPVGESEAENLFGVDSPGTVAFYDEAEDNGFIAESVKITPVSKYIVRQTIHEGKLLDQIIVPGRPPKLFRARAVPVPSTNLSAGIVTLPNVPAFDWSYGCSATSAAMMVGYYDCSGFPDMYNGPANSGVCPQDNSSWGYGECPLSATHIGYDGRGTMGHVDDYWHDINGNDPYIGNWTEHIWGNCTGDFMGTNQSKYGNIDGSTTFWNYTDGSPLYDYTGAEPNGRDGCHGMAEYARSRGYTVTNNYSQYIKGHNGNTKGFTFDQYKNEIDSGRPVMIQVTGHSMLGYGYNAADQTIYLHDTWDHYSHTMTWGGSYAGMQHYGVTVMQLQSNVEPLIINAPFEFSWVKNLTVTDTLTARGGMPPYKDWGVVSGSGGYAYDILENSFFSTTGAGQGWLDDDATFACNLPFTFKYYGQDYNTVNVCTNGYLDFTNTSADWSNSVSALEPKIRIAPLWDDLTTVIGDIYVDTTIAGQVAFRWSGITWSGSFPVNFAAVLFSDGRIRFDYGSGNTDLTPTVGISGGSSASSVIVAEYNDAATLTNIESVIFTPYSTALPDGVVLNSSTGAFSGAPVVTGKYYVMIQVKDSAVIPQIAQQLFTFNISPSYEVTGSAALGDYSGATEGIAASVELLNEQMATIRTQQSVLDSAGNFMLSGVGPGKYYVAAKPSHWLRKLSGLINITSSNVSLGTMMFTNGDCDGDNEVTSTDLSVVLSAMDSLEGDPNWDATADLDGDGEITSTDLSIVLANMDMLGE